MPRITGREQALAIARIGHAVFDKLHTAPVPTFAFINGWRSAAGWRSACTAHYRTVSAAAAGHRAAGVLPRHVARLGRGLPAAQPDRGRPRGHGDHRERPEPEQDARSAPQAAQLGIADALFDGADFLERSLDWAGRVVAGEIDGRPPGDRPRRGLGRRASPAARAFADAKIVRRRARARTGRWS